MNRKQIIFSILAIFLFTSSSSANTEQEVPVDLFPPIEGWKVDVRDMVYTPENLWDLINGAADAYLSYDFKKLYTAEYKNEKGEAIKVYAFKHSNPTNAFGIYSQERNPDYTFLNIGAQGFTSPGALYFITGSYYIQLSTNDKPLYEKLEPVARAIETSMKIESHLPATLNLLPAEGKIRYSEKYIPADFLGYSFLHSAFVADYENKDEKFQVFIMAPETKEEANEILNTFLDKMDYPGDQRDKNIYKLEAKYIGNIALYKRGKYVCGVKRASQEMEKKYLDLMKNKIQE